MREEELEKNDLKHNNDGLNPPSDEKTPSLSSASQVGVTVHLWGAEADTVNDLDVYMKSQLYGGNVGHASISMVIPANSKGDELVNKYCKKNNIPYKKKWLTTKRSTLDDYNLTSSNENIYGEEVYEIYFSFWPDGVSDKSQTTDLSSTLIETMEEDNESERLGLDTPMSDYWRTYLQPESRYSRGKIGDHVITLGPEMVVHFRELDNTQSELLNNKANLILLNNKLESINVLFEKLKSHNMRDKKFVNDEIAPIDLAIENLTSFDIEQDISFTQDKDKLPKLNQILEVIEEHFPDWRKLENDNPPVKISKDNIQSIIDNLNKAKNKLSYEYNKEANTNISPTELMLLTRILPNWNEDKVDKSSMDKATFDKIYKELTLKKEQVIEEIHNKKILITNYESTLNTKEQIKQKEQLNLAKQIQNANDKIQEIDTLILSLDSLTIEDNKISILDQNNTDILDRLSNYVPEWEVETGLKKNLNDKTSDNIDFPANNINNLKNILLKKREEFEKLSSTSYRSENQEATLQLKMQILNIKLSSFSFVKNAFEEQNSDLQLYEKKVVKKPAGKNKKGKGKKGAKQSKSIMPSKNKALILNLNRIFPNSSWKQYCANPNSVITKDEMTKILEQIYKKESDLIKEKEEATNQAARYSKKLFTSESIYDYYTKGKPADLNIALPLTKNSIGLPNPDMSEDVGFDAEKMLMEMEAILNAREGFNLATNNCSITTTQILQQGAPESLKSYFDKMALGKLRNPQTVANAVIGCQNDLLKNKGKKPLITRIAHSKYNPDNWLETLMGKIVSTFIDNESSKNKKILMTALALITSPLFLARTTVKSIINPEKAMQKAKYWLEQLNPSTKNQAGTFFKVASAITAAVIFTIAVVPFVLVKSLKGLGSIAKSLFSPFARLFGNKKADPNTILLSKDETTANKELDDKVSININKRYLEIDANDPKIALSTMTEKFEEQSTLLPLFTPKTMDLVKNYLNTNATDEEKRNAQSLFLKVNKRANVLSQLSLSNNSEKEIDEKLTEHQIKERQIAENILRRKRVAVSYMYDEKTSSKPIHIDLVSDLPLEVRVDETFDSILDVLNNENVFKMSNIDANVFDLNNKSNMQFLKSLFDKFDNVDIAIELTPEQRTLILQKAEEEGNESLYREFANKYINDDYQNKLN